MRIDGRSLKEIRPVKITRHYTAYAEGSVLIECGNTKVLCTASVEDRVPPLFERNWHRLGDSRIFLVTTSYTYSCT